MKKIAINEFDLVEKENHPNNLSFNHIKEPIPRLIKDVLSEFRNEEIDLQPEFQRKFVWTKKKQKALIESLYKGFPLPMFYFAESENGLIEVVDGQQRLTTIFGFLKPGCMGKQIQSKLISNIRLKDSGQIISVNLIRQIILKQKIYCVYLQESNMQLKYEIFQLLNQGATLLKAQEIRNCLFASGMPLFNKLLKQVANRLRKISGMSLDRMMGEELALRFFVINTYGLEKDVTNLLNSFNTLQNDFDKSTLQTLKNKSNHFFNLLTKIFGENIDNCFQVLQKGAERPQINRWSLYSFSNKINQSLFHLLSFYLPKYSKHQISKKDLEKAKYGYLELLKNKKFISVITGAGTNSSQNIKQSKQIFEKKFVKAYLGDWTDKTQRNITVGEKKTILKNVPYCYLCYGKFRKKIKTKNFHAEHIASYKSGSETKFKNILLAHSKCNNEKLDQSLEQYRNKISSIKLRRKNTGNINAYIVALTTWNEAYPLDSYSKLIKFAKSDLKLDSTKKK
jgi:hypothetical protein